MPKEIRIPNAGRYPLMALASVSSNFGTSAFFRISELGFRI